MQHMSNATSFGTRLRDAIATTSPLCVGVDPSSALLSQWGLDDSAAGVEAMGRRVIEAVAGVAAAIKPQVAFFERHGALGLGALERVLDEARHAGILVVGDAKRGDIDSTMSAYGDAWLSEESPLRVDALTVTAYMGLGAMDAIFDQAKAGARGIFVVVASSNPEGRMLQEARTADGDSVEESLLKELGGRNSTEVSAKSAAFGSLGAVVGATRSAGTLPLSALHGPFLVPGVGAQGATPSDVGALFAGCAPHSVLVNASRSILSAGPGTREIRLAAETLANELQEALG